MLQLPRQREGDQTRLPSAAESVGQAALGRILVCWDSHRIDPRFNLHAVMHILTLPPVKRDCWISTQEAVKAASGYAALRAVELQCTQVRALS
jgi:hypothetical protein